MAKGKEMPRVYFTPELFKFLKQLKKNNDRGWFDDNKDRYHEFVRDPFLEFIADFSPRLKKINPHYLADPRPLGGSLFRIYRDVRFAKDKSPYKTHAAAQFNHDRGKNVHAPGFYLHLEPGQVFAGAGIWRPDGKTAAKIRETIAENPAKWKKAVSGKSFKTMCTLQGDKLVRPPRGFDPDHPLIEILKYKDFLAFVQLTEEDVCSADFLNLFTKSCRAMTPLVLFLTEAVGLEV